MLNKASHGLALNSIKNPLIVAPVIFLSAFLLTAIFAHFSTPSHDTSATIDPATYFVNLTTDGNRNFTLNASPSANIGGTIQNLTISTNSPSGYKLYISTNSSDATAGNRLNLNGELSATSAIAPTSGTFSTPATLNTNSWGYSLADGNFNHNGTLNDSSNLFAAMPRKGSEQLIKSTSFANTGGDNLTIYYGVKANNTLPAGEYSNTVVYTVLTEASSVNGGEATISPSTITASGGPVTITTSLKILNSINTLTVSDLGSISTTIGGSTCTDPSYSLDSGILVISCTAPAKTAGSSYDVQVSIPKFNQTYNIVGGIAYNAPSNPFFAITNMQDMTQTICDSITTPSNFATNIVTSASAYTDPTTQVPEVTLTDTRDNKTYKVRKLADGNCWMSENLRLGGASTIALNSTNSNLPDGVTFTLPVAETSANHTNWGLGATAADTPRVYDTGDGSYGNYYNWYTAVAGTANFNTTNSNAPGSICPKGWYLPGKGNAESDYYKLLITIYGLSQSTNGSGSGGSNNVAKMFSTPLSFVLGGYKYSGAVIDQGNKGSYWSRVASSSRSIAFALLFNLNGALLPHSSDSYNRQVYKTSGNAVRCISNPLPPSAP